MAILISSLNPAQCAQRLCQATDPENIGLQGVPRPRSKPIAAVVEQVTADSYKLVLYRNRVFLKEFAPYLRGTLDAERAGSRLAVEVGFSRFSHWLVLMLVVGVGLSLVALLGAGRIPGFNPPLDGRVTLPLAMMGLALIALVSRTRDKAFLVEFLIGITQAHQQPEIEHTR